MFTRCLVTSAKITATFSSGSSATSGPAMVGIRLDEDAIMGNGISFDADYLREARFSKWRYYLGNASGAKALTSVSTRFNPRRFFNITDLKDNHELEGTSTASPDRLAIAHVWIVPAEPGASGGSPAAIVNVTIDFTVLWSDKVILARS